MLLLALLDEAEGERVVLDAELNIIQPDSRNLDAHDVRVAGLDDITEGVGRRRYSREWIVKELMDHPVHLMGVKGGTHGEIAVGQWIPTSQGGIHFHLPQNSHFASGREPARQLGRGSLRHLLEPLLLVKGVSA